MKSLGDPIGTYGISWPEVIRQLLVVSLLGGMLLVVLNLAEVDLAPFGTLLLSLWVGLVFWMFVTLSRRPQIVVYEHGVGLRERDEEKTWRWEQITRWDGQRTTHSYNGIPAFRHGANHFYAGDERLFSISVIRDRADQLANFIFSRLAQVNGLPKDLAAYQEGHTIVFDGVAVSKTGLGGNKQTARWDEIEAMDFKDDHLRIQRSGDRKFRKFGYVSPVASYALMALLDKVRGTDYLARKQAELTRTRGQIWFAQGRQLVKVSLILSPLIILLIAAIAFSDQQGRERHAGLIELNTHYGTRVGIACVVNARRGNYDWDDQPDAYKFLVIDASDRENPRLYQAFQDALPDWERAESGADLTTVVCVWTDPTSIEECVYGDVTRRRYRQDYLLSIIDIGRGVVVKDGYILGARPPRCPAEDPEADVYGEPPTSTQFAGWLHDNIQPAKPFFDGGQV